MEQKLATAEWADPIEFQQKFELKDGDFWLGRSITVEAPPLGYNDDRHICLVAGSRGGKGVSSIIPNLCLWPGSAVVIDPKGENATVTANRRGAGSEYCEGLGQKVQIFDPFNTTRLGENHPKASYNPFDFLDPKSTRAVSEAARIADALVPVKNQKDPFWEQRARSLIHTIILHVLTAKEYAGERNLSTVRKLLMRGDWKRRDQMRKEGHESIPPSHVLLWDSVRNNSAFDVLRGLGERFIETAVHAKEQYEGIVDAAIEATRFLDDPEMESCVSQSTLSLADLKKDRSGVTIYLCLPQYYMNTHSGWLRMMIALSIYEMQIIPGLPASGHRVLFCLDEFAGLKKMDVIEDNIAQIAGFGVKLFVVLQSLEQLKGIYENKWETFLANCGLKIFFDVGDFFTREYVAKYIGETELIRSMHSSNETKGTSESTSMGQSRSISEGVSRTNTNSVSQGKSTSNSISAGKNWGKSQNIGWSYGTSDGGSWKPHPIFFRNTDRFFSLLRKHETTSVGENSSKSGGRSGTSGRSLSETTGTSENYGTSQPHAVSLSSNETYGTNESKTSGTNQSQTNGINETLHKRQLVTPDEIGKQFSRIDDRKHPLHPGFSLVLLSGQKPLVVRRIPYFDDPLFCCYFDPHPDHPDTNPEPKIVRREIKAPSAELINRLLIAPGHLLWLAKWAAIPGNTVSVQSLLYWISNVRTTSNPVLELADFDGNATTHRQWLAEIAPLSNIPLRVKSPHNGQLAVTSFQSGPIQPGQTLGWVLVSRRKEVLEGVADPDFTALEIHASLLETLDQRALQTRTSQRKNKDERELNRIQEEARLEAEKQAAQRLKEQTEKKEKAAFHKSYNRKRFWSTFFEKSAEFHFSLIKYGLAAMLAGLAYVIWYGLKFHKDASFSWVFIPLCAAVYGMVGAAISVLGSKLLDR